MILNCHVILQDHVIEVSYDFMGRNPSQKLIILSSLVAICTLKIQI